MLWSYARTHACVELEKILKKPVGGGSFILYYPYEQERKKIRKYIKLTVTVDNIKYTERKEVKEKIKVTPTHIDMLIKESLINLEVYAK